MAPIDCQSLSVTGLGSIKMASILMNVAKMPNRV